MPSHLRGRAASHRALERGTPRIKVTGQTDWTLDGFALLRATYYGNVIQSVGTLVDYVDTGKHVSWTPSCARRYSARPSIV